MISDSHALSSHSPTPSIPAYTLNTCVRFRHPRLRPRYPHPRHRAYAFNTLAYALDAPTLDTARTRSTPARTPINAPALNTRAYAFNTHVHAFSTHAHVYNTHAHTRSHAQARCLASLALDTCKHASRCRGHGNVGGGADTCAGGV